VPSKVSVSDAEPLPAFQHYPNIIKRRSAILQVLDRAGTPVFLCDRGILVDRYQELSQCLAPIWPRSIIAYSFKTNYQIARLQVFRELGGWAEVVSGREYQMARALGYPGEAIVFNGPYKSPPELAVAFSEGALVNVNDHDELDTIIGGAASSDATIALGMRLSCSLPRLGCSRFGFSIDNQEATAALAKIGQSPRLSLTALHMHLYGDTDDPGIYYEAVRRLGEFATEHIPNYQHALRFIDVGGGFPAHTPKPNSRTSWNPQPISVYVNTITDCLRTFFPDAHARPTIIVEPGRYLTADSVVLITRVLHVKTRDGVQMVTCNGSISMVPLTHYCPQLLRAFSRQLEPRRGPLVPSVIYGATCRENDILYEGAFVEVGTGDYLVHYASGAYNASLTPAFIFDAPGLECM